MSGRHAPPDAPSLAALVRRHDPDRYVCALFAPAAGRETLFTLYAFNHELARACEVTREPGLALIRLQWWREVVEGATRAHEVAGPLRAALAEARLAPGELLAMIEAREIEAEADFATTDQWRDWLLLGAGAVCVAAGRALGAPVDALPRLAALGAGYAAAGQIRNIAALAAQGRCLVPQDILDGQALTQERVMAAPFAGAMAGVRAAMASAGLALLGRPQPCPRGWIAAGLPAVLARAELARPATNPGPRGFADRARVVGAWASGRC